MTAPHFRTRLAAPSAILATAFVLAGCASTPTGSSSPAADAPAEGYPVTVASCGQDFAYEHAPSRVVLGNYRTLPTLEGLGVEDSVHGYLLGPDDQGVAPTDLAPDFEVVSPDTIPAREPVIAAEPDLFLSFNEAQLTGQGTLSYDDLAGIGANAYVMGAYCAESPDAASIDTVYTDITNLGDIFGVPERAQELNAELQDRVGAAAESLDRETTTVAFLKVVDGKVYAIGGYPASAILDAVGLENEFADLGAPFAELNAEQALAMDPDIVFVNYLGDEDAAIASVEAALPDMPAVQAGNVFGADEDLAQGGGVGVVDLLEAIAADVRTAE